MPFDFNLRALAWLGYRRFWNVGGHKRYRHGGDQLENPAIRSAAERFLISNCPTTRGSQRARPLGYDGDMKLLLAMLAFLGCLAVVLVHMLVKDKGTFFLVLEAVALAGHWRSFARWISRDRKKKKVEVSPPSQVVPEARFRPLKIFPIRQPHYRILLFHRGDLI